MTFKTLNTLTHNLPWQKIAFTAITFATGYAVGNQKKSVTPPNIHIKKLHPVTSTSQTGSHNTPQIASPFRQEAHRPRIGLTNDLRDPPSQEMMAQPKLIYCVSYYDLERTEPKQLGGNFADALNRCIDLSSDNSLTSCLAIENLKNLPDMVLWFASKKGHVHKISEQAIHYSQDEQLKIAIEFVRKHLSPHVIQQHIKQIKRSNPAQNSQILITYLTGVQSYNPDTQQQEASSRNQLPATYAYFLKACLQDAIEQDPELQSCQLQIHTVPTPQYSRLNFTDMANHPYDFLLRLITKPDFGDIDLINSSLDPDKKISLVFLVEDDTESGTTMLAFIEKMQAQTGTEIPYHPSVVVKSPGTRQLYILPATQHALIQLIKKSLTQTAGHPIDLETAEQTFNQLLQPYGKTLDQLTNITALCLIALLLNPENQDDRRLMDKLFQEYQSQSGDPLGWMTINNHIDTTGKNHALRKCWYDTRCITTDHTPFEHLQNILKTLPQPTAGVHYTSTESTSAESTSAEPAPRGTLIDITENIATSCQQLSINPAKPWEI